MIVEITEQTNPVTFDQIKLGSVFQHDGIIYMKIEQVLLQNSSIRNAVQLYSSYSGKNNQGLTFYVSPNKVVLPADQEKLCVSFTKS